MGDFLKLYIKALSILIERHSIAGWLIPANCAFVAALFAEPILFGKIIDALSKVNSEGSRESWTLIYPFLITWACVGLFEIICSSFIALQSDRLAHQQRQNTLAETFEQVLKFSATQLSEFHTGRLVKIIFHGTDTLWALWLSFFRDHLGSILVLTVLIPLTFYLNWRMAWLLLVLSVMFGYLSYYALKNTNELQKNVEQYHSQLSERFTDTLGHISLIQSFLQVEREVKEIKKISQSLLNAQFPVLYWWTFIKIFSRLGITITLISMISMGIWLFENNLTTVGEIVTFISISMIVFGRLEQCVQFIIKLSADAPKLMDFFSLLETKSEILDSPESKALEGVKGRIEFSNVSFSYDQHHSLLKNLNFTIEPAQRVAIVGLSGAGKSTLFKLLLRDYEVGSGSIKIDGLDIKDIQLNSLRKIIGVVFQESMLLNRSISENILLGNPEANKNDVMKALQISQTSELMNRDTQGIQSQLGERGKKLSGGERQRVALARALLKNPSILILDEATNALDASTETHFFEAFDQYLNGRTVLLITHRLETLRHVDLILVLSEGQIVEKGSYDELINSGKYFKELANSASSLES
jgi:ATP-binding cassette, subfamily B, beta-glucan exporter